jgi:tetratricopeptide (TPR) repeat protein
MPVVTLFVIGALVVAGLIAMDHLGRMDPRFFEPSTPAVRALGRYLVGHYAEAARLYREDLRHREPRIASRAPSSWIAFVSGDLESAEIQARMESRGAPQNPEPVLTQAEIALARGDSATALTHVNRVLELRRDDYDALLIAAVAHARSGAHDLAIAALKRALWYDWAERRPTVFLAVLETTGELGRLPVGEQPSCLLAHLHRYLRIYDPSQARPALRHAQRAIEVGDHADDAYVTLGVIHTKQRHSRRALEAFDRALTLNPKNTRALVHAARLRADRGELDQEYRLMRAAFEADRTDPLIAMRFHRFLVERLGDYHQALALDDAALMVDPRNGEVWWQRGVVQAQLGNHREALHSYQQAAAIMPITADLANNIGYTFQELGQTEEAFAAHRQAIALEPTAPQAHIALGVLHGKARRWSESIAEFETAAQLGALSVSLCDVYLRTDRYDAAARCATAILTVDPENVQGRSVLEWARQGASRGR